MLLKIVCFSHVIAMQDAVNMCFCCSGQAFAYFVPTRYSVYSRLIDSNSIWTSLQQQQPQPSHFPTPFANHHGWQMNQSFMLLLATLCTATAHEKKQFCLKLSSKSEEEGILNRKCDLRRLFRTFLVRKLLVSTFIN